MRRSALTVGVALIVAVIATACGATAAEPTVVPPTATPAPTRVPRLPIIAVPPEEVSDALIAAMPQEGWDCIENAIGSERMAALTSGSEPEGAEQGQIAGCFPNKLVAGFFLGQVQLALGSLNGATVECVISLLDELPDHVLGEVLVGSDGPLSEQASQAVRLLSECMSGEEAEVFANFGFLE